MVHGHWPCPYTLLCTAKIRTFFKSKQYEQNFLISKEKATAISLLSAVCWLVCAPCRLGQPSILPSSQPHVSNSKISFTAVHGTGLTGLHSARRIHCNVILAHSVIFIHLGGQRDRSVSRRATRYYHISGRSPVPLVCQNSLVLHPEIVRNGVYNC